jgi:Fe-S cluster assembly protein SufD
MLTAAFCRAVLDDLPNEPLREHLSDLVAKHLPQT